MVIRIGNAGRLMCELEEIERILEDPRSGLREIKQEVRDIEELVEASSTLRGPLTTGPLYLPVPGDNAVTVLVQNTGKCPVDVEVRILDLGTCPPSEVSCSQFNCIGTCCCESVELTATEGIYEVVCCPCPDDGSIRAFVSVHQGASPAANVQYVVTAEEMLPLRCPFSRRKRCPDPCNPCNPCDPRDPCDPGDEDDCDDPDDRRGRDGCRRPIDD